MYSQEVSGIISYFASLHINGKVTDVNTPGIHAKGSFHYAQGTGAVGLAVDFGLDNPSYDDPRYLTIFNVFKPVETRLAELICAVPGVAYNIKDGRRVPLYAQAQHHNHVHVAVAKGVFLQPVGQPQPEPPVTTRPMGEGMKAIEFTKIQLDSSGQGYKDIPDVPKAKYINAFINSADPAKNGYKNIPVFAPLQINSGMRVVIERAEPRAIIDFTVLVAD